MMISTGQLIVTLLLLAREIIYPIGAFILIRQWLRGKVRYYTDLPFLLALTMIIMCIYTPIELYYVAFYPAVTTESPFGQIAYLIDLNLITVVAGINFVMLLAIWFPTRKKGILGALIGWVFFTEIAILLSAFVNVALMDNLLILISFPTYIIFIITFFFCHYQKRLPNVHSLLIGTGMVIIVISQLFYPILAKMGTRLAGIYSDASWPAMIIWLAGFLVMFLGFIKKAPYFSSKESI